MLPVFNGKPHVPPLLPVAAVEAPIPGLPRPQEEETMSGTLNLHAGGHVCTRSELASYEPPPETATYRPISHIKTLVLVEELLSRCGYRIQTERLAVDRRGARFFSVIDVDSEIVEGITLAIGLRSSYDMSYPFGLVGGSRTFVCSNLAFSADLINVRSKHTKNGLSRFERATFDAIAGLDQYREIERKRFETYRQVEIDGDYPPTYSIDITTFVATLRFIWKSSI